MEAGLIVDRSKSQLLTEHGQLSLPIVEGSRMAIDELCCSLSVGGVVGEKQRAALKPRLREKGAGQRARNRGSGLRSDPRERQAGAEDPDGQPNRREYPEFIETSNQTLKRIKYVRTTARNVSVAFVNTPRLTLTPRRHASGIS